MGNLIDFGSCVTEINEYGLLFVKKDGDFIEIYDDPTNSYLSWHITQEEVETELYECWKERIKQKSYTKEAFEFERNLGTYLESMAKDIISRIWKPYGYYDFRVYHPERIISAPYYKDRIVEEWLTDKFLKPYLEPKLHPCNIACRTGLGPPAAHAIVIEMLTRLYEKYGTDFYIVQFDIKGYYDNVKHDRIKEQFRGMQYLGYILFMNIINDWKQSDGYAAATDPEGSYGVPKGNLPSQWIGLSYLNEVDWLIDEFPENEGQVRYMDDFIVAFRLKSSCKNLKIKIEKYLIEKDMGIRLHPRKTKYYPISEGITFCGWRYELLENGLIRCLVKNDRKKITKKRMKKMTIDYYHGKLTSFDVKQKLNGTYAFLEQGDTKQLKRYLVNRYNFTRNEETFKKDMSKKFQKTKLLENKEDYSYEKE